MAEYQEYQGRERIMSPTRRLDNMAEAGKFIVNQRNDETPNYNTHPAKRNKSYNLQGSAKQFVKQQQGPPQGYEDEIQSWASRMQQINYNKSPPPRQRQQIQENPDFDLDVDLDMPKMHLVPCRWERSGWKYVQVDPKEHNFFNNPNRVNSFGITPQKRHGSVQRATFYASKPSAFGNQSKASETTYGRFFEQSKPGQEDQTSPWRNRGSNNSKLANQQVDDDTIQWAGENHKRASFRKTKDYIGDWTNVLFRS